MAESKVDLGAGASLLNQDPSYDYPMNPLLPFASRNTMDVDQLSTDYMKGDIKLIVPPILADMLNASVRGGQMLRNEAPLTSEGIASIALDTLPSSALVSGITRDAAMAGPGTVLGMNVFHGTPHVFKPEPGFPQGRPRLDKMGTGEGAQTYGPGFYSAEEKGVAESYRAYLSGLDGDLVVGGQTFKVDPSGGKGEVNELLKRIYKEARLQFTDTDGKFRTLGEFSDETVDGALSSMRASNETREWAAKNLKGRDIGFRPSGSLYKLDIPDADAAKLLDYDAPITKQPKEILQKIEPMIRAAKGYDPNTATQSNLSKIISANGNLRPEVTGEMFFRGLAQDLGGDEAAADALRKIGIPGLKYLDQGSRGSGDGTRNFVVWDQDVLDRTKVLQRNDEKFSRALESFKYGGEVERPMGIESGMADSKVDLGAGAPEGYSFGIAGYGVRPRVFVEGRQTGSTPSVALPEGDVLLDIINQNYYGKIGVDVTSPGGDTFGGAASGSYYRGSVDFPEELQRYGAPDRETYSARGIQSPEYSGYYQMKDGPRFEGYYRDMPKGSDMPDEYGGRVSYTIPFEDGGEVEPVGIEKSVTITQSIPANDPRSMALGSRLLKQAGVPGDFNSVLKNADPRVVAQVNRIMPKSKVAAPSTGIGLFMGLKQG